MVVRFVLLALVWGASFLLIKVGDGGLSPAQVVFARLGFGALALGVVLAVTRTALPRELRVWGHFAVLGITLCVVPFLLFAWAEQHVSSGLASILNATTPLMTMLITVLALPSEKLNIARVSGLLLGFLGVITLTGPWQSGAGGSLVAELACVGATLCCGIGFTYLRRFITPLGLSPVVVGFGQVSIGTVLAALSLPWTRLPAPHLTVSIVLAMVVLGAMSTGFAYMWNTAIVAAWGAVNGAAVTYLTPIVGVVLGIAIPHEPLRWNEPVGAVLVVLGVLAAHGRLAPLVQGLSAQRASDTEGRSNASSAR
ncbi:MAG TPA: DMT family transporter [Pseudonocardiaceae bacterium]|nr:DMT family transporter [Pseudonocardiaceae bacterium]